MFTEKFELNGKAYLTSPQTLQTLRSILPAAKTSNDSSAVQALMYLGLEVGTIQEVM